MTDRDYRLQRTAHEGDDFFDRNALLVDEIFRNYMTRPAISETEKQTEGMVKGRRETINNHHHYHFAESRWCRLQTPSRFHRLIRNRPSSSADA